ncbi:ATP-NAD kinase, partial [Pseudomonas ogarae]
AGWVCAVWRQARGAAGRRRHLQSPEALLVPLARGLLQGCGVLAAVLLEPGGAHGRSPSSGARALDGEREIEGKGRDRHRVTLEAGGPMSIDVNAVLADAAQQRLGASGRGQPQHPLDLQEDTPGE